MSTLTGPLVSVVTPVYNGAEFLVEFIESVLRQTYEDWEYVIVDNRSTDRTLEIAQSFEARDPRIRVVAADVDAVKVSAASSAAKMSCFRKMISLPRSVSSRDQEP